MESHRFGVSETVGATGGIVVEGITGPDLRRARVAKGVSLGRIAAQVRRTKGHLSKVERGVEDREISPALIRDYERALRVRIVPVRAGHGDIAAGGLASETEHERVSPPPQLPHGHFKIMSVV